MQSIATYEIRPTMHFLRRRTRPQSRGQAMVEFAILLPVLALLLVMAIDFGRVFFGWVGLHNAARIAANEAAANPDAWSGTGIASEQQDYRQMVTNDLSAMNCAAPDGSTWQPADIPDPQFISKVGTSDAYENGDHAAVTLECRFDLITPLAGGIVGDLIDIRAQANFAVRGGIIAGVPAGPAPPAPTPTCATGAIVPDLTGFTVIEARVAWSVAGFTGTFSPATGPDDTNLVDGQSTSPTSSPGDCAAKATSVTVIHSTPPSCGPGEIVIPNLVTLTVAQARTKWAAAGFTGSFTPISGQDSQIVTTQSTSTGRDAGQCSPESTLVVVGYGPPTATTCTAPEVIGATDGAAQNSYTTAGFTGAFKSTGPSGGTVTSQSLVGGQPYPCTSDLTVQLKK